MALQLSSLETVPLSQQGLWMPAMAESIQILCTLAFSDKELESVMRDVVVLTAKHNTPTHKLQSDIEAWDLTHTHISVVFLV